MQSKKVPAALTKLLVAFTLTLFVASVFAVAETPAPVNYKVIHDFNGLNGTRPQGQLVSDLSGNFYGTTTFGGSKSGCSSGIGCGTIFKLSKTSNGGWKETVLYRFAGGDTGYAPAGGLVFDIVGNLYGTTALGGKYQNSGVAYELSPQPSGGWKYTVLHSFGTTGDVIDPVGNLTFDLRGNLYGATYSGIFELSPNGSGGVERICALYVYLRYRWL